jgi:hypothetical protein
MSNTLKISIFTDKVLPDKIKVISKIFELNTSKTILRTKIFPLT